METKMTGIGINPQTAGPQEKVVTRISLVTFALTLSLAFYTILLVPGENKTLVDSYMMLLVALSAGYSYYVSRKGNHTRGVYVLLMSIAVASFVYPWAVDNVGWQTAIGMLLITTGIAFSALPAQSAGRVSAVAIMLAMVIVAIELFVKGAKTASSTPASLAVTGVLGIMYLALILNRFDKFPLRIKLIVAFSIVSIMSVGMVGFIVNRSVIASLTNAVENDFAVRANITSVALGDDIDTQLSLLRSFAVSSRLESDLASVNLARSGDPSEMKRLDGEWQAAVASGNTNIPLIHDVLYHPISKELLGLRATFPQHSEIVVTDRYGGNVASTNPTSGYFQADEEWWRSAYNAGRGAIYISQPAFDESTEILSIQMAVPILDADDTVVGVLRSRVNLDILKEVIEAGKFGRSGRIEIYLPDGNEIELESGSGEESKLVIEEAPEDFRTFLQQSSTFLSAQHSGVPVLGGQKALSRGEEGSPEIAAAIDRLEWRIVVFQERSEALTPVTQASRTIQFAGLGALLIAGILAVFGAQFLTQPIMHLTRTAEQVSAGNLDARAPADTADEIGALGHSFNLMTDRLQESMKYLELRVQERTADLSHARLESDSRAQELQSVSEISRVISSEQRLEILLPLITRLVSEKFNFYHTGIFLMDDTNQFAVLHAANSEGGQRMLNRGHKLEIGLGLVGTAASTRKARIALDVGEDAVFFDNPDLPATRSELALPLVMRGTVLGVLDVQSTISGAFTDNDLNILGILADQIAIAIENARLFSKHELSLREAQSLYGQFVQQGWKSLRTKSAHIGYWQSLQGGKPLMTPIESDEIREALQKGETLVIEKNGEHSTPSMVIPIKLHGQTIGVMNIKSPAGDRKWTREEINLIETVSERLALALENARLVEESQRRAAAEARIGEVTSRISASINMQNVLQTAVEELGRSLPTGSEVVIKFESGKQAQVD